MDIMTLLMVLGAEIFLVLFVLLLVSWFRNSAAKRRDQKAVAALIKKVKAGKSEREKTLGAFLSTNMGLQGEALEKAKTALMREEWRLLQKFAVTYRDRNAGAAAQFNISAEGALDAYHELSGGTGATVVGSGEAADDGELEHLRKENARLSEELTVTMDTMSRMLSEYSTMFSGGSGDASNPMPESEPEPESNEVAEVPTPADVAEVAGADDAAGEPQDAREVPTLDEQELDIGEVVEEPAAPEMAEELLPDAAADVAEMAGEVAPGALDSAELKEEKPADEMSEVAELAEPVGEVSDGIESVVADDAAQAEEVPVDDTEISAVPSQSDDELDLGVDDLDALFDAEPEPTDKENKPKDGDGSIAI